MSIRLRAAAGAIALALLVPAAADAQQRNPFSDLFGRAPRRSSQEFTAIQFRSTAGAQRGWTLEDQIAPPNTEIPEGISGGADAMITADYIRERTQIVARGRYSYQEYRQEPAFGAPAFDVGTSASFRPRTRLTLQGGVNFAHSPFYQLMWLEPDLSAPLPRADRAAILMLENDSIEGTAGIISRYTSRSSLELSAIVKQTDYAFTPYQDFESTGGTIMWRRQMTRDLGIHGGYSREQLHQTLDTGDLRFTNERIDVGVEYGRSLTFARRTSFSFGTDTSILRENNGPNRFRLNGNITLDHRFMRTWQLQIAARRGSDFLPGFREPVFTDHAHAALAGFLAKRLLLNLNADGGQGASFSDPRKFISYAGDAKVTFAMTRHFGVFTQYVYTHYQMPADPLTLFLVPRGARQAVSVGIETWVPIFEKEKVSSDPR